MPAPIPLEPPVTNATLPLNEFACVAAINILLVLAFCVLDSPVQNAIQKVYCQGVKTRPPNFVRSFVVCNPLINLLIPSTGNSARSQMAQGLLRRAAGDRVTVESAGTKPSSVLPEAISVLKEVGVDITSHRSKHVDKFVVRISITC